VWAGRLPPHRVTATRFDASRGASAYPTAEWRASFSTPQPDPSLGDMTNHLGNLLISREFQWRAMRELQLKAGAAAPLDGRRAIEEGQGDVRAVASLGIDLVLRPAAGPLTARHDQ
jgi:hypothetical protein